MRLCLCHLIGAGPGKVRQLTWAGHFGDTLLTPDRVYSRGMALLPRAGYVARRVAIIGL